MFNAQGWKQLKRHARTARRLIRTLKKSKYRQAKATKRYRHGREVPLDFAQALQLDVQNGNTKWKDAIDLEIELIKEYQVFKDHGKVVYEKGKVINAPNKHQKIRLHFVFNVKHCGKFKASLVAHGHLTQEPSQITEKNESSHQRHDRQHNDGKVTFLGSLLGCQWSCQMELLFKQNTKTSIKLTKTGVNGHPNWLLRRSCMGNRT